MAYAQTYTLLFIKSFINIGSVLVWVFVVACAAAVLLFPDHSPDPWIFLRPSAPARETKPKWRRDFEAKRADNMLTG